MTLKRHLYTLLHYHDYTQEVGEWNVIGDEKPKLDFTAIKLKVKLEDGEELYALYYEDRCQFLEFFTQHLGYESSYFWCCDSKQPLYNVIAWKFLKVPDQKKEKE